MTKDELIFEWRKRDMHPARQIVPFFIVLAGFGFLFSFLELEFELPSDMSIKSAAVTYFLDDDIGRAWQLEAEEEGPFPGRLEIDDQSGFLNSGAIFGSESEELWSNHRIELRSFPAESGKLKERIAPKGVRYFPSRRGAVPLLPEINETIGSTRLFPSLIPFDERALNWMPEKLPPFEVKIEEGTSTAAWRFVLELRSDGTVAQCFSLSGGTENSLNEMMRYLEALKFRSAEQDSRWVGLRIELLNRESHEPDPE